MTLQLCGADQWGNSVAGVDLIRRLEGKETHVYSTPLVMNKTTGVKFGKSEDGAIWLDSKKTSIYKFYQFWLNVDDIGVIDYIKIYTLLSQSEVQDLEKQLLDNPGARIAQKTLARAVTMLVHGQERTDSVERVTAVLFNGMNFETLNDADIFALAAEIPVAAIGETLINILVNNGIASSNGDARRLITGGAVSINGQKISDDIVVGSKSLIKKGKNSFILVK